LTKEKVRVGVIGAGYWGRKLIEEYGSLSRKRGDVELAMVVDSNRERLATIAKEFGLPRDTLGTEVSRAMNDPSIDAVHVATPNETHYTIGMAALNAGKNLLLEKPMAMTMREALKLAHKADQESLVLHVGHVFRFNNAIKQTRSLLEAGTVGTPFTFRLTWEDFLDPLPSGRDIIFDLCPHPVDILNYLSGEWPRRVRATGRSFLRKQRGREEIAHSEAEIDGDAFATIHVSWLYSGPKRRLVEITGSKGCIETDALKQKVCVYSREDSKEYAVEVNNTINDMITNFVSSVRDGRASENTSLVGAMTVGVLAAMRRSMKRGRFIDVLHD